MPARMFIVGFDGLVPIVGHYKDGEIMVCGDANAWLSKGGDIE